MQPELVFLAGMSEDPEDDHPCEDRRTCPQVLLWKETGMGIVQGKKLPPEIRAQFNIPDDEDAVAAPMHVLSRAVQKAEALS
jgi:hypothetical protein